MSNTTTNPSSFTPETLPVITHHQNAVMTTELLATMYGAKPTNLIKNYNNNMERFVAGKHYYKLDGAELKAFKEQVDDLSKTSDYMNIMDAVRPKSRAASLILWTERGAARHAKMLSTDQAWDVFERLEDAYFERKDGTDLSSLGLTAKEYRDIFKELRVCLKDFGTTKSTAIRKIQRQMVIRLCQQLGYVVPDEIMHEQLDLGV